MSTRSSADKQQESVLALSDFPRDDCLDILADLARAVSPRTMMRLTSSSERLNDLRSHGAIWRQYCERIIDFFDDMHFVRILYNKGHYEQCYRQFVNVWITKTAASTRATAMNSASDDPNIIRFLPEGAQRVLEDATRQAIVHCRQVDDDDDDGPVYFEPLSVYHPVFLVYSAQWKRLDVYVDDPSQSTNALASYFYRDSTLVENRAWCFGALDALVYDTRVGTEDERRQSLKAHSLYVDHALCDVYKRILSFFDHPYTPWNSGAEHDRLSSRHATNTIVGADENARRMRSLPFSVDAATADNALPPNRALRLERCAYLQRYSALDKMLDSASTALVLYEVMNNEQLAPLLKKAPVAGIDVRHSTSEPPRRALHLVYKQVNGRPVAAESLCHLFTGDARSNKRMVDDTLSIERNRSSKRARDDSVPLVECLPSSKQARRMRE